MGGGGWLFSTNWPVSEVDCICGGCVGRGCCLAIYD